TAAHLRGRQRARRARRLHANQSRLGCAVRHRGRGAPPRTGRQTLPSGPAASAHVDHDGPRLSRRSTLSAWRKRRRARDPGAGRAAANRIDQARRPAAFQQWSRRYARPTATDGPEASSSYRLEKGRRVIVLSGAEVVLPDRVLSPGTVVIDDGRIIDI